MHYMRLSEGKPPMDAPKRLRRPGKLNCCSVDGCLQPSKGRGLCGAHWRRWSVYGDPSIVQLIHDGRTQSKSYVIWKGIVQRCTNPNQPAWPNYGGRGITVCDRWLRFENFLADMGERPDNLSIDRIDNDGNYEPGNCRWATWVEQNANRRPHRTTSIPLTPGLPSAGSR